MDDLNTCISQAEFYMNKDYNENMFSLFMSMTLFLYYFEYAEPEEFTDRISSLKKKYLDKHIKCL